MKKASLILGIIFIVLSLVIIILADGLRRWYSGLFFLLIGIVVILEAVFRSGPTRE